MNLVNQDIIKIFITDDHPIFRRGLKNAFADVPDMEVIEEASNGSELLSMAQSSECDVVILDISMEGMNSLDALKQLKVDQPKMPVLIFSVYPEEAYAVRYIKAGAAGYLNKDSDPDLLVEAVRKIANGGKYVSQDIMERLAFDFDKINQPPHERLSDREYQVLCMIGQGISLTEIGNKLSLSVKTIGTHRGHILEKMHLKNNAQLIQYAILQKLV